MRHLRLSPAQGASLAVDHLPGRSPGLVYLHGFTSSRLGEKSERLAAIAKDRGIAFHRFDFRGHGESSGTVEATTLSDLIADTHCVMEHAGPSILFGSSLGGMVASWAVAARPELARGLVLMAPAFGFLSSDGLDPDRFSAEIIEDARGYDENSLAQRLSMRVLLVHGVRDETVSVTVSRDFFAKIPHENKELWTPEDGDHRLHEHFEEICLRMEGMLES